MEIIYQVLILLFVLFVFANSDFARLHTPRLLDNSGITRMQAYIKVAFINFLLEGNLRLPRPGDLNRNFNYGKKGRYKFSVTNEAYNNEYINDLVQHKKNIGPSSTITEIAIKSDRSLLIGGYFTYYNDSSKSCIASLNKFGALEGEFYTNKLLFGCVNSIVIQQDKKIVIGGSFYDYDKNVNNILRLQSNGRIDKDFQIGSGPNDWINCLSIQKDNKIIIAGKFSIFNSKSIMGIARLHPNGSLDEDFNSCLMDQANIETICLQNDGKILVGGLFSYSNGINISNNLARLDINGNHDKDFTISNGLNNRVNSIVIQKDGKILIGGNFTLFNDIQVKGLIRLNSDGTLDSSFKYSENNLSCQVTAICLQKDGKILIGGSFGYYNGKYNYNLKRLNIDGTEDYNFRVGWAPEKISSIKVIKILKDGNIIIGGKFKGYRGYSTPYLVSVLS